MQNRTVFWTGLCGLIAAIVTGSGEFLLHFDALARFQGEYQFFTGIARERTSWGHFLGVLGAPLYLIGCWHIHLMLRPASATWSLSAFLVASYGFVVGAVWIGSRASISALINTAPSAEVEQLVALYTSRYETLLQLIRLAVLYLSIVSAWLILRGRTHYPKWMAVLNPMVLTAASFVVYAIAPALGKYLMPIALNVGFLIFFGLSLAISRTREFP